MYDPQFADKLHNFKIPTIRLFTANTRLTRVPVESSSRLNVVVGFMPPKKLSTSSRKKSRDKMSKTEELDQGSSVQSGEPSSDVAGGEAAVTSPPPSYNTANMEAEVDDKSRVTPDNGQDQGEDEDGDPAERIEDFDWVGLEEDYHKRMEAAEQEEEKLYQDFNNLIEVHMPHLLRCTMSD